MLTQANVPAIMIALSKSTQFPRERNREMRIDTEIAVNPMSAEAKDTVIAVMRRDRQNFTRLVEDPKNWNVMSRIAGWEVRDLVGHMIDVLEGYFRSWEAAIGGKEQIPLGLSTMAEMHYDRALEFRVLFRDETLARFKKGAEKFDKMLDSLTPEQWEGGLIVSHPFAGPVPAGFYATFQIMDYGVHVYDIEYGLGNKLATMDEASARLILPFAFTFWQFQVDQEQAAGQDFQYGRYPGGSASGDPEVIERVRALFFDIEPVNITPHSATSKSKAKWSLLDVAEAVKVIEDEFGIKRAAPVAVTEYTVNGLPARLVRLRDGSCVHVELYETFVAVTWSTTMTPNQFLNRATQVIGLGPETTGLVVDSLGHIHADLEAGGTMDWTSRGSIAVARLDDAPRRIAVVWELNPPPDSAFAEVGVLAAKLDRSNLERLFLDSCTQSLQSGASAILDNIGQLASNTWGWTEGNVELAP